MLSKTYQGCALSAPFVSPGSSCSAVTLSDDANRASSWRLAAATSPALPSPPPRAACRRCRWRPAAVDVLRSGRHGHGSKPGGSGRNSRRGWQVSCRGVVIGALNMHKRRAQKLPARLAACSHAPADVKPARRSLQCLGSGSSELCDTGSCLLHANCGEPLHKAQGGARPRELGPDRPRQLPRRAPAPAAWRWYRAPRAGSASSSCASYWRDLITGVHFQL